MTTLLASSSQSTQSSQSSQSSQSPTIVGLGRPGRLGRLLFGPFGPILAAALPPLCHTRRVDGSADDVIADTWQIGDAAAANQDHGVLLQVMADPGDV